jgi:hypothetical protein
MVLSPASLWCVDKTNVSPLHGLPRMMARHRIPRVDDLIGILRRPSVFSLTFIYAAHDLMRQTPDQSS